MSDTPTKTKGRAKKDDYIVQGSILAAAAVLTKIIGVVYRIPLTNILGDEEGFRLICQSKLQKAMQSFFSFS